METATVENNWQENLSGTIGNVVFQKNNRIRIKKIQGRRKRPSK
jgi:hypothetical protein